MTWYYNNITPIKNILAAFFMGKKIETTVFRIWGMLLHLHKLVNKILIVKLWFYKNSKHDCIIKTAIQDKCITL